MGVPNDLPLGWSSKYLPGIRAIGIVKGDPFVKMVISSSSMDQILLVFCRLVVCLVGAFSRKEVMKRSSKCNMFRLGSLAVRIASCFLLLLFLRGPGKVKSIHHLYITFLAWVVVSNMCLFTPNIRGSWSTSTYAKMFIEKGWLWKPPTTDANSHRNTPFQPLHPRHLNMKTKNGHLWSQSHLFQTIGASKMVIAKVTYPY